MRKTYNEGVYYLKVRGRGVSSAYLTPQQAKVMFELVEKKAFEFEGVAEAKNEPNYLLLNK